MSVPPVPPVSFSDFFTEEQRLKLNPPIALPEATIHVGSVYRVILSREDGLTLPPGTNTREKIVVIIGFNEDSKAIGVVLVNSITESMYDPMIKVEKYPDILDYNSYVGIDDIFIIPDSNFNYGNAVFKGEFDIDDMIIILENLDDSKNIPKKDKKLYRIHNELTKLLEQRKEEEIE